MKFDLNKLSNREKNIVGILFVILATVPFFYLTLPSWNNYTSLKSQIKSNQDKLNELNRQIQRLEKLKKENINLLKKVDEQKLYLAKSYEIDFLVQDLKNICDESSISLESFTPSNSEPVNIVLEEQLLAEATGKISDREKSKQILEKLKGQDLPVDLYRFPIEVKISGNFTDFIELFKKLEKYGRIISVDNISIGKIQAKQAFENRLTKVKSKKEDDESNSLYGSFELVAYSAAKEGETLPFTDLKKKTTGTGKFSYKSKKAR